VSYFSISQHCETLFFYPVVPCDHFFYQIPKTLTAKDAKNFRKVRKELITNPFCANLRNLREKFVEISFISVICLLLGLLTVKYYLLIF
jgi:hypothetical protein